MSSELSLSSRENYVLFGYDCYNCFTPATERELCDLEQRVGSPLPADYRQFLSTFNGGTLADILAIPKRSAPPNASNSPRSFYAIGQSARTSRESSLADARDRCTWLPRWFLPIGLSSLKDSVGLSLKKESYGSLYVFDYKLHAEGIDAEQCAFLVANSFSELFSSGSLCGVPEHIVASSPIPAFRAIQDADFPAFRRLIAGPEQANQKQDDAYCLFLSLRRPRFVRYLLGIGANPHVRNSEGTPLNRCEVLESVNLLLQHGANPNSLSSDGVPPLLQTERFPIHKALLEAGADVNYVAQDGRCVDIDSKRPGLRDLWNRHGLDIELICRRLCELMSALDTPWESIEDDEDVLTVGETRLISLINEDRRFLRNVVDVERESRNALVSSRAKRVLRCFAQ